MSKSFMMEAYLGNTPCFRPLFSLGSWIPTYTTYVAP